MRLCVPRLPVRWVVDMHIIIGGTTPSITVSREFVHSSFCRVASISMDAMYNPTTSAWHELPAVNVCKADLDVKAAPARMTAYCDHGGRKRQAHELASTRAAPAHR